MTPATTDQLLTRLTWLSIAVDVAEGAAKDHLAPAPERKAAKLHARYTRARMRRVAGALERLAWRDAGVRGLAQGCWKIQPRWHESHHWTAIPSED